MSIAYPQFWPLFISDAEVKSAVSFSTRRVRTWNKKWQFWGTSGSLQTVYSMCTHQAHVIKNFDVQNLVTFLTIKFGGVVNKFLSRGCRKFFSPFFLAKNKSFEQKTPFETKNSGLQWLFEDLSSSRKNPQDQIFTHFRISGEITKEMVFLRISGEITTGNWI